MADIHQISEQVIDYAERAADVRTHSVTLPAARGSIRNCSR